MAQQSHHVTHVPYHMDISPAPPPRPHDIQTQNHNANLQQQHQPICKRARDAHLDTPHHPRSATRHKPDTDNKDAAAAVNSPLRTPTMRSPDHRAEDLENYSAYALDHDAAFLKQLPALAFGTPISGQPLCCHTQNLAAELRLRFACANAIGPRSTMEDRSVCKLSDAYLPHGFFAVYDGHGGADAAEYCAEHLHANLLRSPLFPDAVHALQDAFLTTDASLLGWASRPERLCKKASDTGAAAAVCVVTASELVVAHVGDCRAILIKRDGCGAAAAAEFVDLSSDHVADDTARPDEAERVVAAGGCCEAGYVYVGDNNLPMTRAFGNLRLKVAEGRDWRGESASAQVVTALPTVSVFCRSAADLALVVASDGLFGNVMSSAEVARETREQLAAHAHSGDAEGRAARHLVDAAFRSQSGDNVSVVVVSLEAPLSSAEPPALQLVDSRSSQMSQMSIATEVCSPGRICLQKKLSAPFGEAYEQRSQRPSPSSAARMPLLDARLRGVSDEPCA